MGEFKREKCNAEWLKWRLNELGDMLETELAQNTELRKEITQAEKAATAQVMLQTQEL